MEGMEKRKGKILKKEERRIERNGDCMESGGMETMLDWNGLRRNLRGSSIDTIFKEEREIEMNGDRLEMESGGMKKESTVKKLTEEINERIKEFGNSII